MIKMYKDILDQLDNLMVALGKQKRLGLDPDVVSAFKDLTRARNEFKRNFIRSYPKLPLTRDETVFTYVLDAVADNTKGAA